MATFSSRGGSRTARGRGRPRGILKSKEVRFDMSALNGQQTSSSPLHRIHRQRNSSLPPSKTEYGRILQRSCHLGTRSMAYHITHPQRPLKRVIRAGGIQ